MDAERKYKGESVEFSIPSGAPTPFGSESASEIVRTEIHNGVI